MKCPRLFVKFGGRPLSVAAARRRRHGQRGVSALEFAIVGPLAIFVLFLTIELAVILMADALLARVAANITRTAQLERISGNCGDEVKRLLEDGMGGWFVKKEDFIFQQVAVYNPSVAGGQESVNLPPGPCNAAQHGGAVVFKVGFKTAGFTGAMKFFQMGTMKFERSILIQNGPK